MRRRAIDLAGKTTLGALGALIEGAEALVCNDTSVSHIAAALACPSVVVSCGADVARWAPLDADRHRVLWQIAAVPAVRLRRAARSATPAPRRSRPTRCSRRSAPSPDDAMRSRTRTMEGATP